MKLHPWAIASSFTTIVVSLHITQKARSPNVYNDDYNRSESSIELAALWSGLDVLDDESYFRRFPSSSTGHIQQLFALQEQRLKRLKVMGYMNSGTNLALALVIANLAKFGIQDTLPSCNVFRDRFPMIVPGAPGDDFVVEDEGADVPRIVDKLSICDDTWTGSGIWKHTPPFGKYVDQLVADPDTVIIALMRNPFSLLESLIERPYSDKNIECVKPPTYGGPGSNCTWELLGEEGFPTAKFSSLAEWWNFMASQWTSLEENGKAKVLLTSYEELVLYPSVVLTRVFDALGYQGSFDPSAVATIADPQGPGSSIQNYEDEHSSDEAVAKIKGQTFLNKAGTMPDQVIALCAELDEQLLAKFNFSYACAGGQPVDAI